MKKLFIQAITKGSKSDWKQWIYYCKVIENRYRISGEG